MRLWSGMAAAWQTCALRWPAPGGEPQLQARLRTVVHGGGRAACERLSWSSGAHAAGAHGLAGVADKQAVPLQEVWVPGSFELPLIAKAMAASGKYDAVLALGAVVRPFAVLPSWEVLLHCHADGAACLHCLIWG